MSDFEFPKVEYVIYESSNLPTLGVVKFRPFLVGEHKRILEATEVGGPNSVLDTMAAILKACTFGAVDTENIEMYILDKLYLEIFIRSRGPTSPASYRCQAQHEGEICGNEINVNIPLDRAEIFTPPAYSANKVIKLNETSGIKLRHACLEDFKKLRTGGADMSDEFLYSSVECIFNGDKLSYPGKDFTLPALVAYLETLPDTVMQQITDFFQAAPKLRLELPVTCTKCGHKENIKLEGLDDFFV